MHAADSIQTVDSVGNVGQYTSLAVDSNGFPVISYFGDFNLKLVHCNDPNCAGNNESLQTVDSNGNAGAYTSLVLDRHGFPVISYYDYTNVDLKLVHCNDPACAGNNESLQTVDSGGYVGAYTSLVLDGSGFPVISYLDSTNDDLKLVRCNDPNCAGNNESIQTVDAAGGAYTSLVLDGSGFPVISHAEGTNGALRLKLVHCNDPNCANNDESYRRVDSAGNVGAYTSLVLDGNGFPVISYYDGTNGDLKLVHCNDPNCADDDESLQTVDSNGNVGAYTSLVLDGNGFPVISYYNGTTYDLKLVHCNDANCAGNNESIRTVDSAAYAGAYTSLVLDGNGFPVISYSDVTNHDLKLVHCNDANCAGNNESIRPVDSAGSVGWSSSLALDSNGFPVISYYDDTNDDLKLVHCNDANCAGNNESIRTVDSAAYAGAYTSLVLDGNGFPVISYYDDTNDDLKLAHCDDPNCAPPPPQVCGNSLVEGSEQCDDGNTANGDCCSSACQFEASTTVCRASAGVCDIAETCTGSSGTCPAQTFQSPSTVCRASTGACDVAETCTGSSVTCPAQTFQSSSTVCRAAMGECDVAETCTGASAECPSDSVKTNSATCTDDGNVCSTDICNGSSTECQHPAGNAGTVCRASTGACDVAETCTGASLSCPADTGAPDSDGDGQCDASDVCTNGVAIIRGKIGLSNFATGTGDDAVNFSGTLAFSTLPLLDPIANGVRVRVEDTDGALFDVMVPGGAYNATTKTGWKINAVGSSWKFSRPTAVGGTITQVTLTKRAPQVKFTVKGIKGAFASQPVTFPLQATVVLTPPLGISGICGGASFAASQCAFNAAQTTLSCK